VSGSIYYGTEDVLRKNNQRIFCTNGGMVLAAVAVIFIISAKLLEISFASGMLQTTFSKVLVIWKSYWKVVCIA
jgi:hypothetical protein